jgi:aryl-alcohol dehydrogenase-like predicted oxidoreductase
MRYRPLGTSGLVVSVVGLGCNNFGTRCDLRQTRAVVDAALDAGITLFDTADSYGQGASERYLGEILRGRRDEVVIATKFGMAMEGVPGWEARGSGRYVRRAIEASLKRLHTDRIDLYQYHRPDGVTPVEETLAALDELFREGKILYAGSSNFAAWQVVEAEWTARERDTTRFVSAQNRWSLLERDAERELVPACVRYGIGVLPYFPLASGLLTGKYRRGEPRPAGSRLEGRDDYFTEENWRRVEALEAFARERGRSLLDVTVRRSRRASGCRLRDRGCDASRAGTGERRCGRVGADARRPRSARERPNNSGVDSSKCSPCGTSSSPRSSPRLPRAPRARGRRRRRESRRARSRSAAPFRSRESHRGTSRSRSAPTRTSST